MGLGFVNEYRAEKAAEALHSQVRHRCVVLRDGHPQSADVTELVPGDVVDLQLGEVVPADLRLLAAAGLECEESVLTGESLPADKSTDPVPAGTPLAELSCCALMGTVVHAGSGTGVVVATGGRAEFGRIALGLGERQPETEFQIGLRKFSMLLVQVAGVLTGAIFVINVALHRPVIDALLFSLAIAVGISPQLLPAVVSTSLAAGSRQLARRKVLVKRLVCIEDLGDIEVLFTDKTGTLTEGSLRFMRSSGPDGRPDDEPLLLGLLCNEAVVEDGHAAGGNPLDVALWDSPAARTREGGPGPLPQARHAALRPRPARGVGPGGGRHRQPDDHHQGGAGGSARAVRRRARGCPHRAGRRVRRREPGGCRRQPRRPGPVGDHRGRRAWPAVPRPAGVPRPAQGHRPPGAGPAGRPRRHGQGPHRGQPGGRGEGLRRPRPAARAGDDRRGH